MAFESKSWVTPVAKAGLIAKGTVYSLVGVLAFMAAFEISGRSNETASKEGALKFIENQTGGQILLLVVAAGLVCYSIWRGIQAFSDKTYNSKEQKEGVKKWAKKARYAFSGLVYLSLAFLAFKVALHKNTGSSSGKSSQQTIVAELLDKPYGQILVGIFAAILAGVGIYQIWYALSEKYKQKVSQKKMNSSTSETIVKSGKIGFIARGFVYLILAYLALRAALSANSSEAGDTTKAFQFLESSAYGSYLLGLLGLGLLCYGIFNYVRARYERFE